MPIASLSGQYIVVDSENCGLYRTIVSVTKGIGNELLGGLSVVALCVGGKGEKVDMQRLLRREALHRPCDRVARISDFDIDSMSLL